MKYEGVKDEAFKALIEAAHVEAVEKMAGMELRPFVAERLHFLVVEFSGRLATRAGQAEMHLTKGIARIKLNYRLLKDKPAEARSTYLHELAHIVANLEHFTSCHHDGRWKRIAVALGDSGERCHKMDVSAFRKAPVRVEYICTSLQGCTKTYRVTKQMHAKIKAQPGRFKCKCGQGIMAKVAELVEVA